MSIVTRDGRLVAEGAAADLVLAMLRTRGGDDPVSALALMRAHGVPAAAVAGLPIRGIDASDAWIEAREHERAHGARISEALARIGHVLSGAPGAAVAASALGPLWMRDIDLLVVPSERRAVVASLRAEGFIDLSGFSARSRRGVSLAVVDGTEVLAPVDISECLFDGGPSAEAAIRRAAPARVGEPPILVPEDQLRRRAGKVVRARRVSLREALEVLVLLERLPDLRFEREVAAALARCSALERELGSSTWFAHPAGAPRVTYDATWWRARARGMRRCTRALRPAPRVTVSFSGVDGAGKSTQSTLLVDGLQRAGVPAAAVWARVGYSGSRLLSGAAGLAQRLLPARHHSAQRDRAAGTATADRAPLTRRGIVGWSWALAVTADYLRILRLGVLRSSARVVVFDRGLPDALVGLDEEFGGAVDLRLQRWLMRRWGPRADVIVYLRLSGHSAFARKEDSFAADVLEAHAHRYESLLPTLGGIILMLDASRPREELAHDILVRLADALDQARGASCDGR